MTMKTRIRYCVIGANAAIEIVRVREAAERDHRQRLADGVEERQRGVEAGPAEEASARIAISVSTT